MRKLQAPHWDSMEDFDAIIQHKASSRMARLQEIRPMVESSYRSYASMLATGPRTSTIAELDGREIVQCYEVHTDGLKALKDRLDELNEIVVCPYCDINVATTFDHHLPKREFPELSICAYNLVRACHSCQNDERATKAWCDELGRRLLLHPYYDPIDDGGPFFIAKIDVSTQPPRVDYALSEAAGRGVTWFARLGTHWQALDLRRRYSRVARQELGSVVNMVRSFSRSAAKAQEGLRGYADRECRSWGPNHWRVALYAAAADDLDFIRYALRKGSP